MAKSSFPVPQITKNQFPLAAAPEAVPLVLSPIVRAPGLAEEVYRRIRADLALKGTPIGPYDLMIAAIAVAHGVTLVTHNTAEFSRVVGLNIEDWESP